jgi:dolichyl-phosphate beta-glucosyltransferase
VSGVPRCATTFLIPAFDEADRLAAGVARLRTASDEGRVDLERTEVIFIDDGSTDATAEVAEKLAGDLPHGTVLRQPSNLGKGAAIRAGVRAARTPQVLFTDADFAIDPRQAPALLEALTRAPVAVGTRAIGGHIDYGSWLRTRAGRSFNTLVRSLSNISMRDTQCGFKAARTAHAKLLFHYATIDGFAFDVEMLSIAGALGWQIAEVPVSWRDVAGSHVDVARHSAAMVADLAKARLSANKRPALLGLTLEPGAAEGVGDACADSSLEAAPMLTTADGRVIVLAALHVPAQASPALQRLRTVLGGGIVRPVSVDDVAGARRIETALR